MFANVKLNVIFGNTLLLNIIAIDTSQISWLISNVKILKQEL